MRSNLLAAASTSCLLALSPLSARAAVVSVASVAELKSAIAAATPGTVIEVAPGTYAFSAALWTASGGAVGQPITLRAAKTGDVRFDFSSQEGIVVAHADWVLEHLWVNGACAGGGCGGGAAGVHVKVDAHRVVIHRSRVTNWGECIKTDRSPASEPADGSIIGNEIANTGAGFTDGGTAIDVVGGLRWRIVGNYIHDFARDVTHYGIFVKGGARDAVIERNLVIGAKDLPPGSGAAVGISFGGGGTGAQFCATDNQGGGGCACEAFGGIARNNLVLKTTDAGLHTKRACGSVFAHNTVYATGLGLQVQTVGAGAPVELRDSVLGKGISGAATSTNNLLSVGAADWKKLYADPDAVDFGEGSDASAIRGKATAHADVVDDYFGAPRAAAPTLGAVELPTTGDAWPWQEGGAPTNPGTGGSAGAAGSAGAGGAAGAGAGGAPVAGASGAGGGGAAGKAGGGAGGAAGKAGGGASGAAGKAGGGAGGAAGKDGGGAGGAAGKVGGGAGAAGGGAGANPTGGASQAPAADDGGCACSTPRRGGPPSGGFAALAAAWALVGRRRRR